MAATRWRRPAKPAGSAWRHPRGTWCRARRPTWSPPSTPQVLDLSSSTIAPVEIGPNCSHRSGRRDRSGRRRRLGRQTIRTACSTRTSGSSPMSTITLFAADGTVRAIGPYVVGRPLLVPPICPRATTDWACRTCPPGRVTSGVLGMTALFSVHRSIRRPTWPSGFGRPLGFRPTAATTMVTISRRPAPPGVVAEHTASAASTRHLSVGCRTPTTDRQLPPWWSCSWPR